MNRSVKWSAAAGTSAAAAILAAGALVGPGTGTGGAASHVEAPLVTADPQIDGTDLYAFTSPDRPDTVTLIADYQPAELPGRPYSLATDTDYDMHVDGHGTGRSDVTFRWTFTGKGQQRYSVREMRPGQPDKTLVSDAPTAPAPSGKAAPDFARLRHDATVALPGGGRAFAGQAKDPFFFNLKALLLIKAGLPAPFLNFDLLKAFNVNSMALQVPKSDLALNGDTARNPVIGVWATAARRSMSVRGKAADGHYVQVSRMGNPLFNEGITATDTKDRFNAISPADDPRTPGVHDEVADPHIVKTIQATTFGGSGRPPAPRKDLDELFMTGLTTAFGGPIHDNLNSQAANKDADARSFVHGDELRLNMSTPVAHQPRAAGYLNGDRQGFPNGRRLGDEIGGDFLRMLLGEPQRVGNPGLVDMNDSITPAKRFIAGFPYVAAPIGS